MVFIKKIVPFLALCLLLVSCGGSEASGAESKTEASSQTVSEISLTEESSEEISAEESSAEESKEESMEELKKIPIPENAHVVSNLTFANGNGRMGDDDGPAYCVYSKVGYNKASMDVLISQIKINNIRQSDGKFVNDYMFLGCDIYYDKAGNNWMNCFDCGFCYSGRNGAWHLFYNIYEPAKKGSATWYESSKRLNSNHDYRLILDSSEEDSSVTVTIYDITADKVADTATFGVKGIKADGSNTSYLMDFAIDYPENIRKDTEGNTSGDWKQITLYNTDEDLYIQNILVENVKICKNGEELDWTASETHNRGFWPDKSMSVIDYEVTKVIGDEENYDTSFRVDLDMNR